MTMPQAPDATSTDAYEAAKSQAQKRIDDLEGQRTTLLASLDTATFSNKDRIAAQIRSLETALSSAYRDAAVTARASASAATKAAIGPSGGINSVAALKADADSRRADAMETRANAYAEGTAAKRQQLEADARLKDADAHVAQAKADLTAATTPDEINKAHVSLQQAQANLDATTTANKAAGYNVDILGAKAAVAGREAQAGARTAEAGAATAEAGAAVAPQAAQAAVDQATANVNKTNQELADLQRQARQAPTDAQAQQAIQTQISQKQTELQAAQLQLQQAQKLMPLAVAGAEQTLQKNTLGTLYGLQDKAKAIADALRSGQITDPAVAQQQLQDYITTTIQGTTPFERDKFATEQQTTRRGQDLSLAGTQSGVLGSAFSSGLSTFGKLNDTVPVGSDAAGLGFIGSQRMMLANLQAMRPPAMDSPLLSSLRPTTAMPTLPAVTPSITQPGGAIPAGASLPSDAGSPGHTININIGGTGGAAGVTPMSNPPAAGDPYANAASANTPAFLSNQRPATPDDVAALWAGDQHYDPTQQPNSGRAGVM